MSKVVIIPVSKLKENSFNNKVYNVNDKLFDYFVELIKEFGILEPLIIDNDFNIISGNRRYKAALQLGIDVVPAIFSSTPVSSVSSILHNQQRVKTFSEMLKEFKVLHSKSGTKQGFGQATGPCLGRELMISPSGKYRISNLRKTNG